MEIRTKYLPSFRLTLFMLALPVFGLAQQFPVNNQKIVQGVGTTAQGISSYSSSPPTTAPTAATFRHVTSLHMDTVLQVQYIYKRPRWYPISVVRRATPPPATASSGSTTIDYSESIWQSTADSLTYYYEEENACWQPIGTYLSSTTPVDVAATGSTGAICYGYGLWYDPDVDSIYAQQGATWTAIGAGGGTGAVDSIAVLQDSIIVGYSEGVEVTRDTVGYPVYVISSIPGLADSLAAAPSGTGTNQRIVVWTGTNSQGNSTQLQSAAGVTLDANLAYRITGGTTASRPTGAAGMMYWNTSNVWWDYHNGTAWFNPLRSATATGLGTAGRVFYADASGLAAADDLLRWDATSNYLGVGTATPLIELHVEGSQILRQASSALQFRSPSYGNPTTFGSLSSEMAARLICNSGAALVIQGYSNLGSTAGFRLQGHVGATTTSQFAFVMEAYKNDGGTGRTTLAATEKAYGFYNGDFGTAANNIFTILGNGDAGHGTIAPDRRLHSEVSDAVTNTIVFPLRLTHITSGTAAAGSGAGLEFEAESAGGTNRVAGTIENPYTTATNAAEVSDLVFRTMRAGTLTESLRSLGNGTLQIGTLNGTATQLMGATSGNIATAVTLGAGLSFSSGTLNGAFLPLTLTGTTEVNTAGQTLRIRDAGGYPDLYMDDDYFVAASDVNTFVDVGSTSGQIQINSAGRTIIAAATNLELQSGITGEMRFDGDSLVLEGVYPVGTASDSVLVRDGSTNRVKLVAQGGVGTWLKPELEAGNSVSITGDESNNMSISGLTDVLIEATAGTATGGQLYLESGGTDAYGALNAEKTGKLGLVEVGTGQNFGGNIILGDTCTVTISAAKIGDSAIIGLSPNGNAYVRADYMSIQDSLAVLGNLSIGDITNGDATAIPGYTSANVLTTTTLAASLTLSSGTLSTAQSFFNDYDASITLTGITATPDTIDADSNVKSNDFAFNTTTNTYTYNGVSGRYYSVSVSAQMVDVSGNGERLAVTVYQNGSATSAIAQAYDPSVSGFPVSMHGQAILLLANGDTINAKVSSTSGAGDDFNLLNYSLIIKEI